MIALPRRQSFSVLILVLAIVATAFWIGRPASEAAPNPARSAPPTQPVAGAGTVSFASSPGLTLPITSFQVGAGRGVSSQGQLSNISLSEATVTLASSSADPRLLQMIGDGDFVSEVTVLSGDKNNGRRQWIMTNATISGASWARDTKEGTVSLSFNYATITLTTYNNRGEPVGSYCAINRPGSDCNVT